MSAPRPIPGRDQQQQQQQRQTPSLQALAVWQPTVPNLSPPKSANYISGPLELKTRDPLPLLPPVPTATYPSLNRTGSGRRAPTLRNQPSNPSLRHKTSQPSLRGGDGTESRPRTPVQSSAPSSSLTTPDQSPHMASASSLHSHSPGPGTPTSTRSGNGGSYFSNTPSPSTSTDLSASLLSPPFPANSSTNGHNGGSHLQRSTSRVQYTSPLLRSPSRSSNNRSGTSSPALSPSPASASSAAAGGGGGLRRQGSILKNAPKDAPYLYSNRTATQLENLTQSWEPSPLQQQHNHQQFLQQQHKTEQPHVSPKSPISGPATGPASDSNAAAAVAADVSGPDSRSPTSSLTLPSAIPHDASEPHPQQQQQQPPSSTSSTSSFITPPTVPTVTSQDGESTTTGSDANPGSTVQDEQTLPGSSTNSSVVNAPAEEAAVPAPASSSSSQTAPAAAADGPKSNGVEGAEEQKEDDQPRYAPRDSTNYKVPVPPSPAVSPRVVPVSRPPNSFGFLSSDPTAPAGHSGAQRQKGAPPIHTALYDPMTNAPLMTSPQHPSHSHSRQGSQSMTSPIVSPTGRRQPYHPWETLLPPMGHGQDHHDDGDHEDEGNITDGDVLSGGEDQRYRRSPRQDAAAAAGYPYGHTQHPPQQYPQQQFPPQQHPYPYPMDQQRQPQLQDGSVFPSARSAPQPSNLQGAVPNSRQAEIQHIMYIQQQQALFLQEKAMNQPLNKKTSNGNLSGGDAKSKRNSRHRKKISVISDPKLVSSTNQVRTVPIVRPADDSDGDDAGTKSEYTSGGEGIKRTVRKMKKAVRHVLPQNDDGGESDGGHGSKSDVEHRKSGLKQLKALKSKLAKKLHRPSHSISGARDIAPDAHPHHLQQHYHHDPNQHPADGQQQRPVQFFSEENLRSRYLAQAEGGGGQSFAEAGSSLRRSNTTREGSVRRYAGDKEEYYSDEEGQQGPSQNQRKQLSESHPNQENGDKVLSGDDAAAAKKRMDKFTSRTFDKDEMIEFRDASGDTFFVPKWDQDPRADELGSSRSVISVTSSRKLERSTSSATVASTTTNKSGTSSKPLVSIAERLQESIIKEGEEDDDVKTTKDAASAAPSSMNPSVTSLNSTSGSSKTTPATVGPLFPEDGEDSDAERHRMAKQIERELFGEKAEARRKKEQGEHEKEHHLAKAVAAAAVVAGAVAVTGEAADHAVASLEASSMSHTSLPPSAVPTAVQIGFTAPEANDVTSTTTTAIPATTASSATSPRTSVGANDARVSVLSDASSNVSSIGGVANAQVLTRQPSIKRNFKRQGDNDRMPPQDTEATAGAASPVGLGISLEPASPTMASPNKIPTREMDIHGRLDAVLAQMSLTDKSLPALPVEAAEQATSQSDADSSSLHPPLKVALPVRPLSPIRRAGSTSPKSPLEFFRNASIGSLSSMLSNAAATSKDKTNAPLPPTPAQAELSSMPNSARSSSQSSMTVLSVHGTQIDLTSAPTAPLPTPTTIQPPTSPFPGVLARQGSMLAERMSVKSMYADSIYDYYAYDSASEHESVTGDARRLSHMSVSQSSHLEQLPELQQQEQEQEDGSKKPPLAAGATVAAASAAAVIAAMAVAKNNSNGNNRASILSTRSATSVRSNKSVTMAAPASPAQKGEEQHVHFEELPKAVPFRMSMMTTVAVEGSDPIQNPAQPSRPPRHPMRQSRLSLSSSISSSYLNGAEGSNPRASMLSMLSSVASSSDFTNDSWISKRQTRDDLENWEEEHEQQQQQEEEEQQEQGHELAVQDLQLHQQQEEETFMAQDEAETHCILEADVKPRHPLSVSGSSSESENDSKLKASTSIAATSTAASSIHNTGTEEQQQQQQQDIDANEPLHDETPAVVTQVREPPVRLPQWKRKTWDPNHPAESGSGSNDESEGSSSSDSESSSSSTASPSSHRRRRRGSSRSSSLRGRRPQRSNSRSSSTSSSFASSRSSRSRASSSQSRSRSRSTSLRRNANRQSIVSSSRRSSRSSHFYFDGHSTSDEEEADEQQAKQKQYHQNTHAYQPDQRYHLDHEEQEYEHSESEDDAEDRSSEGGAAALALDDSLLKKNKTGNVVQSAGKFAAQHLVRSTSQDGPEDQPASETAAAALVQDEQTESSSSPPPLAEHAATVRENVGNAFHFDS